MKPLHVFRPVKFTLSFPETFRTGSHMLIDKACLFLQVRFANHFFLDKPADMG